jgi:hypothetical protein
MLAVCGSVTFWYRTVPDPRVRTLRTIDLRIRIRILLFSAGTFKRPQKIILKKFFAYYF